MRKNTAISLLALLLFNVIGYYVWFAVEQVSSSYAFAAKIGKEVNCNLNSTEDDVFIAKIKASIYGSIADTEWEGTGGEILYDGKFYAMVHQRVLNDTLYIYCVSNKEKTNLVSSFQNYVKTYLIENNNSDNDGHSSSSNAKFFHSVSKDFLASHSPLIEGHAWDFYIPSVISNKTPDLLIPSTYFPVFAPPPEA